MSVKVWDEYDALHQSLEYFQNDELAAKAFLGKYALRNESNQLLEATPTMMHTRLASEFARIEQKYPNPLSFDEIFSLLAKTDTSRLGMGPVVPQGSPMSAIGNQFKLQSLSNCFVIDSPQDSYGGIFSADEEEAQVMKRRGGVGFDISSIRPKGMTTSNAAGTTDGIAVFMERFSNTCREVAQGGRRGALMLTISVKHPEVETFINIKRDRTRVTGANISVRVTDEFMHAVEDDSDFTLQWPVDVSSDKASITKTVRARDIWEQLIDAAWDSAEPGVLFWDTAQRFTPADAYSSKGYGSISTNPCVVGQTLIAVADGRNAVSIQQLAIEKNDVPVYSTNCETGQIEIKLARNPRKTGEKVEVWKLTFDDGSALVATPNHKILLRELRYVELKDLKPGDSVVQFASFESNGYRQIVNSGQQMRGGARRNRRQYRLIHEFYSNSKVDAKEFAIHHRDFDNKNDSFENLEVMTLEEHTKLHAEKMKGNKNPYHQMTFEWKQQFASHPGELNGRYSGYSNDELLEHGRKIFQKHGKITSNLWAEYAKAHKLPQYLSNNFRFGSWANFANQVSTNHKVVSVEFQGFEDVYNLTVDDNHNYHVITSYDDEKYVVSSGICVKNCGEIVLSPYDSCRLLVVDLTHFVQNPFNDHATFDFLKFDQVVQKAQRLMDDLIDLELEAVDRIIQKIELDPERDGIKRHELELWKKIKTVGQNGRRTGLGITGLADAVAMLNVKYGSVESVEWTDKIYRALALGAYRSTVNLAKERGTFPVYDFDLEKTHPFLTRVMSEDAQLCNDWKQFGRRNIALTTTAPVGTVSALTQTTSGIEPAFLLSYTRRKKINANDKDAKVDFVDKMGDKWQHFTVHHHNAKQWMNVTNKTDLAISPYHGATSNDIDWVMSVRVQAAAQKWICHSISKTCNLPQDVAHDLVSKVYFEAWKSGCKGFTVYRDRSRDGVLVSDTKISVDLATRYDGVSIEELEKMLDVGQRFAQNMPSGYIKTLEELAQYVAKRKGGNVEERLTHVVENHAPRRLKELECDIHQVKISGEIWTILVGLLDGKPYEVFGGLASYVEVPKKIKRGLLVKNGKKDGVATYNLKIKVTDDDELLFKDIVNLFANPIHGAFTRTLSLALRHGIPVQYIVEQLQKDKHSDMMSFSRVIARVLKAYIPDGTKSALDKSCSSCGVENSLVYQEGCVICKNCSASKCG